MSTKNFGQALSEIIDNASEANRAKQPQTDEDYEGDDGLMYCHKCNSPRQTVVDLGNGNIKTVWCDCKCMAEKHLREAEELEEKKNQRKVNQNRSKAFYYSSMREWTFERDDRKNPRISDALKRYVDQFSYFYEKGQGLLLYGTVGTGKTYLAACVVNAVIDNMYSAKMTNFSRILNELQSSFDDRQKYIDEICKYSLLVIDDLGAERDSGYAREQVYSVIDSRYQTNKPIIITTNLSYAEIVGCTDMDRKRIYDRILERCHPIEVKGESRRKERAKQNYNMMNHMLGL